MSTSLNKIKQLIYTQLTQEMLQRINYTNSISDNADFIPFTECYLTVKVD